MKEIMIKVEQTENSIKLTRLNGDTFTSTAKKLNEELSDFFHKPDEKQQQPAGLIEALEKIVNIRQDPGETSINYAFNRCWHIASEALSSAPSPLQEAGWIAVEDRLPEVDTVDDWNEKNKVSADVWTFGESGMRKGRHYHNVGFWTVDGYTSSNGVTVTHWQPLPQPPIPSK